MVRVVVKIASLINVRGIVVVTRRDPLKCAVKWNRREHAHWQPLHDCFVIGRPFSSEGLGKFVRPSLVSLRSLAVIRHVRCGVRNAGEVCNAVYASSQPMAAELG